MGKNNLLWLVAGAVGVYLLMPEKVKEVISGAGGGGVGITMPGINLGGLVPNIKIGGTSIAGAEKTVEEVVRTIYENIPTELPVPNIPGIPTIPIPEIPKIPKIPIPEIPKILKDRPPGKVGQAWSSMWNEYTYYFSRGFAGGISGFKWVQGGWQKENTVVGNIAEALVNFFDPHHAVTLTDYARNILASRSESPNIGTHENPVTEKNPTTKPLTKSPWWKTPNPSPRQGEAGSVERAIEESTKYGML